MQLPKWIKWLDRRVGSWGVPNIIRILVVLNIAVFVLDLFNLGFAQSLTLDPVKIFNDGEWWRFVTFLFATTSTQSPLGILFFIFGLMFLWNIGEGLELEWGALPLNIYILLPALFLIALALSPWQATISNVPIAAALLFAFATIFPDYEISLFPIPIPFKIKWLGIVFGILVLLNFLISPSQRLTILAGLSGYFIFFAMYWFNEIKERMETRARRRRFQGKEDDEN